MLMSGLMIFNVHPQFYWGRYGADHDYSLLEIGNGDDTHGFVRVAGLKIPTAGVLGVSGGEQRAFPGLVTIPTG